MRVNGWRNEGRWVLGVGLGRCIEDWEMGDGNW